MAAAMNMVFERVGDPVITSDASGTGLVFNRRARELFGTPGRFDPLAGWTVTAGQDGGVLAAGELPLTRALRGESFRDLELEARAPDGRARGFRVSGQPLRGDDGGVIGAVVGFREVPQADRRVAGPRAARSTLDHLPLAVSLISAADGELLYVNAAWEAIFGYAADDALGQHVSLIATPTADASEMQQALDRTGRWHGESESRREDGEMLWIATDVSRFEHPEHGPVLIGVQADISAERAERVARTEAAQRWSSAFEDAPVGMAIIAPDLRMIDVNDRLCALSGYPRRELLGTSLATLAHPDDMALDAESAARLRAGEIPRYRVDKRLRRPDGQIVPVTITVSLVRSPDSEVMYELAVVAER